MQTGTPTNKLHPLIATAAVAVTAVSVLGAAVLVTNQVSAQHSPAATSLALPTEGASAPAAAPQATPAPRALPASRAHATAAPAAPKPPVQLADAAPAPLPPSVLNQMPTVPSITAQAPGCSSCGTVTSVRELKAPGEGTGIGVIAGAVLGGVIGNQFGRGGGKDASRVLGAIGGAVAGHQIEKQARATVRYEVTVQMEDGSLRTLTRAINPGLNAGDRVRVEGDDLRAADGAPLARVPQFTPDRGSA